MNKKNTIPLRADEEFKKIVNQVMAKNLLRGKSNVHSARITLAIARQYKKYPDLLKELEEAKLE